MKYILSLFIAATLFLGGCSNTKNNNTGSDLSPTAFSEKMKELPGGIILDVRTPEEFESGHLQNAVNADWNGDGFEAEISKLDKAKPVFVYCLSGARSASAANRMRTEGFKEVYQMDGGIIKWNTEGLPMATGENAKPAGMTMDEFIALTKSDKIVLVDFYADWCAPCKKMEPFLKEISSDMSDKVVVVRVNTDKNMELCKELNIDAIPVLQVYKNSELTWSNKGFVEKEEILKNLL